MFEQGGSSRKVPMIKLSLSSDEENFIADTSRDAEFTKKLFGDLNRNILGPLGDGKVIVLDDFDEEKEAQEKKMAGTKLVATSAAVNPALTTSVVVDNAPVGAKTIIVMIRGPITRLVAATATEVVPGSLRPPR
jgi:hypothetical protein